MTHEDCMKIALEEAQTAFDEQEMPIGAIIVKDGEVIARAHNTRNRSKNAVDHAEVSAIQSACKTLDDWRLSGCDLYVTLEPCVMCLGACFNARISNLYFGAYDVNGEGCVHIAEIIGNTLNHELTVCGGILEKECAALLTEFFKSKRGKQ